MNRFFKSLFSFCIFIFSVLEAGSAFADLQVRTAEHESYTRIVFDWDELPDYQVDKETEKLLIRFEKSADIGQQSLRGYNILAADVVSGNPLSLELKIPKGSETRYFSLGGRVILDIYDTRSRPRPEKLPPVASKKKVQGKPEQEDGQEEKQTAGTGEVEPSPSRSVKKPESEPGKIEQETKAETSELPQPNPDDLKVVEESTEPGDEVETAEKTEAEAEKPESKKEKPDLIAITATKSFGMAIFENQGQLYMIVDNPDILVQPQVSGPNADYFLPVQKKDLPGGQVFSVDSYKGASIVPQGTGLVWEIFIQSDEHEHEPPKIERRLEKGPKTGKPERYSVFIPLGNISGKFDFKDPITGESLVVFSANDAENYLGVPMEFVDFEVLPSYAGIAIRPKTEGLQFRHGEEGLLISKPGGLAVIPGKELATLQKEKEKKKKEEAQAEREQKHDPEQILFDFREWRMGGLDALNQNTNIIFNKLKSQNRVLKIESIIALARMHLASGRGAESLGFLRLARQKLPELAQSPEFLALRGVAKAFDWKTESALNDLSAPSLEEYDEISHWKAFVLADLGDWQQAAEIAPDDFSILFNYTSEVRNRLALVLAEIKLRAGKTELAEDLFVIVEKGKDDLNKALDSQLQYLKGEAARQYGDIEKTIKLWEPLVSGKDDLYRAKAGLALTRLLVEEDRIAPKQAIDRLERLRYAWRGDELEAQINYWLGRTYFESGEYIKGLKILRNTIPLAKNTTLANRVAQDMASLFTDFYTGPTLDTVSPLEAVALYEEFTELVPSGDTGNLVVKRLAESLVKADLLGRAAALFQYQIAHRLESDEAARTAVRLAAIRLLDKKPQKALAALNKAESILKSLPEGKVSQGRFQELELLKARAHSQAGRPDLALAILEEMPMTPDVNRLRADIAWQAGYWDDAAYALKDVIHDENISLTRPLTDRQADLILSRAVALNLAGDRIGLAKLREKYGEAMKQTEKARIFEVVTRPRQSAGLSDRTRILSAAEEVDLFKDFLDSYKQTELQTVN